MLRGPRPLGSNTASMNTLPKKALDFGNSGSFPNPTSHKGASLGSIFAGKQANLQTSLSSNSPLEEEAQEIRSLPFANKGVAVAFIFSSKLGGDDAEEFTSEMHDPCTRGRCLQKITTRKHLTEGTGVEPAKYPPKVKSEIFLQLQSVREESVTRTFYVRRMLGLLQQ